MNDQREGAGDAQNIDDEESELAEEEVEELRLDGSSNFEIVICGDVASSFGDLSRNGSLDGVLKTFQRLRPMTPVVGGCQRRSEDVVVVSSARSARIMEAPTSFNTP